MSKKFQVWVFVFFIFLLFSLEAVIPEKIIICIICRDISTQLPEIICDLEDIGSLFQDYRIVAYENNSEDDTPSGLYKWKRSNPKVSVTVEFLSDTELTKSIVNQKEGRFSRLEQRAQARNKALTIALSQFGQEFSYIICIDPNVKISCLQELRTIFQQTESWDAVFAYGTDREGNFNDWEAFRNEDFPFGPELIGDVWYRERNHFSLQQDSPWHPVYSAFGGLAIYNRNAIQNCKYTALVTLDLERVTRKCFYEGLAKNTPLVTRYLQTLEHVTNLIYIEFPSPQLPKLSDVNYGIHITKEAIPIVWRMHGSSDRYPAVCEHVPFHASMYHHGYQRLFINPRLVSVERDSHYASHPSQDEL